jgi:negative regulator of flagellin synthesis FlgM
MSLTEADLDRSENAMKVKSTGEIRPVDARRPDEAPRASSAGRASAPPDTVSTAESARLAEAVAAVRSHAGSARTAKLEAIEAAVRQGTFRPDPARIAQQILQDAELSATLLALLDK